MTSYLRPDEKTRESEIKKAQGRTNAVKSGLETAATAAIGGLGLTGAASKILPFLNQYIPKELAFKGINKIMPGLGNFLKNGMAQGLSLKSGLDYLKDEFIKEDNSKQNLNLIEQESPELFQFIDQEIKKGRKPIEAAALAQNDKRFSNIISKLMKKHKTPWSSIIESLFGSGDQALSSKQEAVQKYNQHKQGLADQERARFEQGYPQSKAALQGQQGDPGIADAFGQMGGAITGNLYSGLFDALQKGKNTFAGVKDPILKIAKPYFDKGLIRSPQDLQKFVNGDKSNQGQQQGKLDPGVAQIMQQGAEILKRFQGQS